MKDIVSQFAMQLTLAEKRELVAELKGAIAEEEWIGYTKLDSFVRAGRVRRSPWRTRSTPGISPTSSSGR